MTELTSTQRKYLRGLSHDLKAVVQIGQHGLSDRVLDEIRVALDAHELIKIKLVGERTERQADAEQIAQNLGAGLVGVIGKVAIIFRPHQEVRQRRIRLPA